MDTSNLFKRLIKTLSRYGGPLVVFLIVLAGLAYANVKFFHSAPQDLCEFTPDGQVCDLEAENFKYGTLGGEAGVGIPYPLFAVLPEVFADLMPGPGGWRSFGLAWEEGKELPVGLSKKRLGFDRITQTCAICHTATYRLRPGDKPTIVPSGPGHTTDIGGLLDFTTNAAKDARFTADTLLPPMKARFDLGWDDQLIYRFLVIPLVRKAILEQGENFAFKDHLGRPEWGPGRDAPFNLTKFILVEQEDDGTVDNADFPAIWNLGARKGQSLNWAGETQDPLAVIQDSALGLGGVPGPDFVKKTKRIYEYLATVSAPKIPEEIAPDPNQVRLGALIYDKQCASCHDWDGPYLGKAIPIQEIGTDAERFNAWDQTDADQVNQKAADIGVQRKNMVKDVGYVSGPLDGIWLRAPYLHNGSVPNMMSLLLPPDQRPTEFYRGCDLYDAENMGFISHEDDDNCPSAFFFDTKDWGNGNGGHDYGTRLTESGKKYLIAYLKTL